MKIGPHRRVRWLSARLDELKTIKNGLGGTVNDVFLAVVSGALRRWLLARGLRVEGLELRGCVPVSVRAEDEQGQLGNKITMMACPLPISRRAGASLRDRERGDGPPEALQAGARRGGDRRPLRVRAAHGLRQGVAAQLSSRVYNLLVTAPGPQFPLYLLGRELQALVPVPFLAPEKALAIAIMSYNGRVDIGLMGDYAMPDLADFAGYLEDELGALAEAAGGCAQGRGVEWPRSEPAN